MEDVAAVEEKVHVGPRTPVVVAVPEVQDIGMAAVLQATLPLRAHFDHSQVQPASVQGPEAAL